jgi:hypothetical protein
MLEHEADPALARAALRGAPAFETDIAGIGELEAGDDAQQRRLARARGAEQGHQLAVADTEIDAVEGHVVAETLGQALDLDTHGAPLLRARAGSPSRSFHSMNALATSVTKARPASSDATANAATKLYSLYRISTCSGIVFVCPRI